MNIKQSFLGILLILALAVPAFAQRSQDLYGAPRSVVIGQPQNFVIGTAFVTNGPIDVRMFDGNGVLTLFCATNTGTTGGTMTANIYGSDDQTNFTALTYALSTATTVSYTNNRYGGTNLTSSSTYLLPGTWTTPTAATAGWATPYFAQAQFTNTAGVTVTGRSFYNVGLSIGDCPRYLYVVWQPGGTATNFTAGALLTGTTHSSQLY